MPLRCAKKIVLAISRKPNKPNGNDYKLLGTLDFCNGNFEIKNSRIFLFHVFTTLKEKYLTYFILLIVTHSHK